MTALYGTLGFFGRPAFTLQRLPAWKHFIYLIQDHIQPKVHITHPRHTGRLAALPIRSGQSVLLRRAAYRKHKPVIQNVAVYWHPKTKEPWYLMTDLKDLPVKTLTRFYRKRMTIEEYFRDLKSRRTGWGLRLTLIRQPRRLGRLLLLLALAYLLLSSLGLFAHRTYRPQTYANNNREHECSFFFLGRWLIEHEHWPPLGKVLKLLRNELAVKLLEKSWG